MKNGPEDHLLRERLESSRFSAHGFMGDDARDIADIVADDRATLARLGMTEERLAQVLRQADQRVREAQGGAVELANGVWARHREAMGRTPSPFRGDGLFAKGETEIIWPDGRCLRVTALSIALIERHGFFQGHGAPYRISPELAVDLCRAILDSGS